MSDSSTIIIGNGILDIMLGVLLMIELPQTLVISIFLIIIGVLSIIYGIINS